MSRARVLAEKPRGAAPGASMFVIVAIPFFAALTAAVLIEQGRTREEGARAASATHSPAGVASPAPPGSAYGFGIGFE